MLALIVVIISMLVGVVLEIMARIHYNKDYKRSLNEAHKELSDKLKKLVRK